MEKMNVVVSMVKTRFYDFPAAILLIAEIVFDKETHSPRISGTYTRTHQGNFPNEPHFEPRAGLVPEGNSNSSPSGAVGDHHRGSTACTNVGREESGRPS